MNIPILIMAAGSSSRLGRAKQLLPFKGETLISYTVKECLRSSLGEVFVVLGSRSEDIKKEIQHLNCTVIENKHWENGLGSSIACGVEYVHQDQIDGVIVLLIDQIYFSKPILTKIVKKRVATKAPIIMCSYNDGAGPPTFFESALFKELLQLNGEPGAKKVIQRHRSKTVTVTFPKGHLDIDKEEDLKRLRDFDYQKE